MRKFSRHRGPGPALTGWQLLRAHFGLTQQDMARLLGVSRAAVAMDERGERTLPTAAVLRQSQLLVALSPYVSDAPLPVPAVGAAPVLSDYERETLRLRLLALRLEEHPLQNTLARCQTRLGQARLRLQALPALRTAFPGTDERAQRWLNSFEEEAAAVLRNDAATPALLGLQLAVRAFEAAEITRLLGEEGPPV